MGKGFDEAYEYVSHRTHGLYDEEEGDGEDAIQMIMYREDGTVKDEYLDSPVDVYESGGSWIVEDIPRGVEYECSSEEEAIKLAADIEDGYIEEW